MSFKRIGIVFFSYAYLAFIALSCAVMFVIALALFILTAWFDKRKIALNLFSSFWASMYLWFMPAWSVKIEGREKMDMDKSYVIVSNHQSQLDILVAFNLFFPFRWVSKAEVFKLPFIGWNMLLNGHIKLKRGDKTSIQKMMEDCEKLLAQNISIILFPEGTRSKDGLLKPFKPGAFILAKKMKKPILPMVINNTKNALPKHALTLQGAHEIRVSILDEIPYERIASMEVEDVSDQVRDLIASHIDEHKALEAGKG